MKEKPEFDDFDSILVELKTGKWQALQFLSTVLAIFIIPSYVYAGAFLAPTVDFSCVVPADFNYTKKDECTLVWNDSSVVQEIQCENFIFSNETFGPTLTSEFDLVCGRAYLRSLFQTTYVFVGIGSGFFNGMVSDKIGRRGFSIGALLSAFVFQMIPTFSSNLILMLICRSCIGILPATLFLNSFNWSMEVCEPKKRSFYGIILTLAWAFGFMWFGLLGYLIRDWVWLQRAGALPCILVLIILWSIDDSPRWLIVTGRHDEALRAIKTASKLNNVTLAPDESLRKQFELIQNHAADNSNEKLNENGKSYKDLVLSAIRCTELRRRAILVGLSFFCAFCVYEGLSLNAVNFDLDPFLYMIQGGAVEVLSYSFLTPIVTKWGRTRPSMVLQITCGISILALTVLPSEYTWTVTSLAMLGKFSVASSFQIVFLIASEIIPTEAKLVVWCSVYSLSKIGAVGATFLTGMVHESLKWLPALFFGGFSFAAAFVMWLTPESMNMSIPDTIESLEMSTRKRKSIEPDNNPNTKC